MAGGRSVGGCSAGQGLGKAQGWQELFQPQTEGQRPESDHSAIITHFLLMT